MTLVLRNPASRLRHYYGNPLSWLTPSLPPRCFGSKAWNLGVTVQQADGRLNYRIEVEDTRPEDLDVSISDGVITVKGERRRERQVSRGGRTWREVTRSSFSRSLSLPDSADWEKAEASFEDGVLEVSLGLAKKKVKNIKIEAVEQ